MDILETIKGYVVENFLFGDDIRIEDDDLVPGNMNSLDKITFVISRKVSKIQPV